MLSNTYRPTQSLLTDPLILTHVQMALLLGASKRAIGRKLGLNWQQVDLLVAHVQGKGVRME